MIKCCPHCGKKYLGTKFCAYCGADLSAFLEEATDLQEVQAKETQEVSVKAENVIADFDIETLFASSEIAVQDKRDQDAYDAKQKSLRSFEYSEHDDGTITIINIKDRFALNIVVPEGVIAIADGAFEGGNVMTVKLPNSLQRIGNRAFKGSADLMEINFPSSLMIVGDEAFMDCTSLETELPKTVRKIGRDAMKNTVPDLKRQEEARKIEDARQEEESRKAEEARKLRDALEKFEYEIKENGTYEVTGLKDKNATEVVIPYCVTSIGREAFSFSGLKEITIPSSVTSIGDTAFWSCGLTSVTIPSSVTNIGEGTFFACGSLTKVTMPDSVTNIGANAFTYCRNLENVMIPSHVISIGDGAFSGCNSLTKITIPDSVKNIGKYAFYRCENLESANIPRYCEVGEEAFPEDCTVTRR